MRGPSVAFAVVIVVLTTTFCASAQEMVPSASTPPPLQPTAPVPWQRPAPGMPGSGVPPPPPPLMPVPMVTVDNSRRLMWTGIGLTIAGSVVAPTGYGLVAYGIENPSSSGDALLREVGGILFTFAGSALLATGIPLWIAGEYDIEVPADHPKAIEQSASVELRLGPAEVGVVARF